MPIGDEDGRLPRVRVGGRSRPVRVSGVRRPPRLGGWVRPGRRRSNPGRRRLEWAEPEADVEPADDLESGGRPRARIRPRPPRARAGRRGRRHPRVGLAARRRPGSRCPARFAHAGRRLPLADRRAGPTGSATGDRPGPRSRGGQRDRPAVAAALARRDPRLARDRRRRAASPDRRRRRDRGSRLPPAVGERPRRHRPGRRPTGPAGASPGPATGSSSWPCSASSGWRSRAVEAGGSPGSRSARSPSSSRPSCSALLWPYLFGVFDAVRRRLARPRRDDRPRGRRPPRPRAVTIPWSRPSRAQSNGGRVRPLLHCAGCRPAARRDGIRRETGAPTAERRQAPSRMDQIFGEIGDAVAGFFGNPVVQLAIQAIAIYLIILWLAGAYWAFRDMQQRSENPILPYVAASFVIIFTPIFFPLAIFVYKIIRPHEKIGEVVRAEPRRGGAPGRGRGDQELPDLRAPRERGMDHLPDVPDPPQPRLPELQPARRARLVAVRVVRQGLRAARRGARRLAGGRPGADHAAPAADDSSRLARAGSGARRAGAHDRHGPHERPQPRVRPAPAPRRTSCRRDDGPDRASPLRTSPSAEPSSTEPTPPTARRPSATRRPTGLPAGPARRHPARASARSRSRAARRPACSSSAGSRLAARSRARRSSARSLRPGCSSTSSARAPRRSA